MDLLKQTNVMCWRLEKVEYQAKAEQFSPANQGLNSVAYGPKHRLYFHWLSLLLKERLNCWNIWSFQVQVSYVEMCAQLLNSKKKLLKIEEAKYNSL